MNFDIDSYISLIDSKKLEIIKQHIIYSDIPLYLKHENINNTIWITNSIIKYLYNISLSDFENYYPSSTFQDEIIGLRTDIHSPIYRNKNIFLFDCSKIKYTHFDYVIKILSYLIKNTELDFNNLGKKKDIFDFTDKEKPKLFMSSKNNTNNKNNKEVILPKTNKLTLKNKLTIKNYEISKKCKQFWILNPNNAIELFLKKIEVFIQNNCEFNNFIFVSSVNKIKYKTITRITTSSSIINIKLNELTCKKIITENDKNIDNLINNNKLPKNDKTLLIKSKKYIINILLKWLNNDIILIKLSIVCWLKKIAQSEILENKKLLQNDIENYCYQYIMVEIPLFKLSNTLFQNFSNAKTINPIIDYYQYSFSLLSIPNIINELVYYFNMIISNFLKYSKFDCIKKIDFKQRIDLLKLITELQYNCIFLDKPISQLQSFFVDCIKVIKKY